MLQLSVKPKPIGKSTSLRFKADNNDNYYAYVNTIRVVFNLYNVSGITMFSKCSTSANRTNFIISQLVGICNLCDRIESDRVVPIVSLGLSIVSVLQLLL